MYKLGDFVALESEYSDGETFEVEITTYDELPRSCQKIQSIIDKETLKEFTIYYDYETDLDYAVCEDELEESIKMNCKRIYESSEKYLVIVKPVKGNRAKLSEAIDMWNEENPNVEFRYNDYQNQYFNFNMTMANAQDVLEFFLPYGRSIVDKIEIFPNGA